MRKDGKSKKKNRSRKSPQKGTFDDFPLTGVDPQTLKLHIVFYLVDSGLDFYVIDGGENNSLGHMVVGFNLTPDPDDDDLTDLPEEEDMTDYSTEEEDLTDLLEDDYLAVLPEEEDERTLH